jgi:hypothetical protein
MEDAADRAEKAGSLEERRAILKEHEDDINTLVTLTEAVKGRYTLDQYTLLNVQEESEVERSAVDRALNVIKAQVRSMELEQAELEINGERRETPARSARGESPPQRSQHLRGSTRRQPVKRPAAKVKPSTKKAPSEPAIPAVTAKKPPPEPAIPAATAKKAPAIPVEKTTYEDYGIPVFTENAPKAVSHQPKRDPVAVRPSSEQVQRPAATDRPTENNPSSTKNAVYNTEPRKRDIDKPSEASIELMPEKEGESAKASMVRMQNEDDKSSVVESTLEEGAVEVESVSRKRPASPAGFGESSMAQSARPQRRRLTPKRTCHVCKSTTSLFRSCQFHLADGSKCDKAYCNKCLILYYLDKQSDWEDPDRAFDPDWL